MCQCRGSAHAIGFLLRSELQISDKGDRLTSFFASRPVRFIVLYTFVLGVRSAPCTQHFHKVGGVRYKPARITRKQLIYKLEALPPFVYIHVILAATNYLLYDTTRSLNGNSLPNGQAHAVRVAPS